MRQRFLTPLYQREYFGDVRLVGYEVRSVDVDDVEWIVGLNGEPIATLDDGWFDMVGGHIYIGGHDGYYKQAETV